MKKLLFGFCALIFFAQNSSAAENNLQMFNTLSETDGSAFGNKVEKQVLNSFIEKPLSNKCRLGRLLNLAALIQKA